VFHGCGEEPALREGWKISKTLREGHLAVSIMESPTGSDNGSIEGDFIFDAPQWVDLEHDNAWVDSPGATGYGNIRGVNLQWWLTKFLLKQ
jgi:hypothetical protein